MTEKFDNIFHKRYVGGEGEIAELSSLSETKSTPVTVTIEETLSWYRKYMNDPKAELPEEILKTLLREQRTENGRT